MGEPRQALIDALSESPANDVLVINQATLDGDKKSKGSGKNRRKNDEPAEEGGPAPLTETTVSLVKELVAAEAERRQNELYAKRQEQVDANAAILAGKHDKKKGGHRRKHPEKKARGKKGKGNKSARGQHEKKGDAHHEIEHEKLELIPIPASYPETLPLHIIFDDIVHSREDAELLLESGISLNAFLSFAKKKRLSRNQDPDAEEFLYGHPDGIDSDEDEENENEEKPTLIKFESVGPKEGDAGSNNNNSNNNEQKKKNSIDSKDADALMLSKSSASATGNKSTRRDMKGKRKAGRVSSRAKNNNNADAAAHGEKKPTGGDGPAGQKAVKREPLKATFEEMVSTLEAFKDVMMVVVAVPRVPQSNPLGAVSASPANDDDENASSSSSSSSSSLHTGSHLSARGEKGDKSDRGEGRRGKDRKKSRAMSMSEMAAIRKKVELDKLVEALSDEINQSIRTVSQQLSDFSSWGSDAVIVNLPVAVEEDQVDTRLYSKLLQKVPASCVDVPMMLYCMFEQVAATNAADDQVSQHFQEEDSKDLMSYLDLAMGDVTSSILSNDIVTDRKIMSSADGSLGEDSSAFVDAAAGAGAEKGSPHNFENGCCILCGEAEYEEEEGEKVGQTRSLDASGAGADGNDNNDGDGASEAGEAEQALCPASIGLPHVFVPGLPLCINCGVHESKIGNKNADSDDGKEGEDVDDGASSVSGMTDATWELCPATIGGAHETGDGDCCVHCFTPIEPKAESQSVGQAVASRGLNTNAHAGEADDNGGGLNENDLLAQTVSAFCPATIGLPHAFSGGMCTLCGELDSIGAHGGPYSDNHGSNNETSTDTTASMGASMSNPRFARPPTVDPDDSNNPRKKVRNTRVCPATLSSSSAAASRNAPALINTESRLSSTVILNNGDDRLIHQSRISLEENLPFDADHEAHSMWTKVDQLVEDWWPLPGVKRRGMPDSRQKSMAQRGIELTEMVNSSELPTHVFERGLTAINFEEMLNFPGFDFEYTHLDDGYHFHIDHLYKGRESSDVEAAVKFRMNQLKANAELAKTVVAEVKEEQRQRKVQFEVNRAVLYGDKNATDEEKEAADAALLSSISATAASDNTIFAGVNLIEEQKNLFVLDLEAQPDKDDVPRDWKLHERIYREELEPSVIRQELLKSARYFTPTLLTQARYSPMDDNLLVVQHTPAPITRKRFYLYDTLLFPNLNFGAWVKCAPQIKNNQPQIKYNMTQDHSGIMREGSEVLYPCGRSQMGVTKVQNGTEGAQGDASRVWVIKDEDFFVMEKDASVLVLDDPAKVAALASTDIPKLDIEGLVPADKENTKTASSEEEEAPLTSKSKIEPDVQHIVNAMFEDSSRLCVSIPRKTPGAAATNNSSKLSYTTRNGLLIELTPDMNVYMSFPSNDFALSADTNSDGTRKGSNSNASEKLSTSVGRKNEYWRCITREGVVIKKKTDGSTQMLLPDGNVSNQRAEGEAWEVTNNTGCQTRTVQRGSDQVFHDVINQFEVASEYDSVTKAEVTTREDFVMYIVYDNGSSLAQHADGTRIYVDRYANENKTRIMVECPGFLPVTFEHETKMVLNEVVSNSLSSTTHDIGIPDGTRKRLLDNPSALLVARKDVTVGINTSDGTRLSRKSAEGLASISQTNGKRVYSLSDGKVVFMPADIPASKISADFLRGIFEASAVPKEAFVFDLQKGCIVTYDREDNHFQVSTQKKSICELSRDRGLQGVLSPKYFPPPEFTPAPKLCVIRGDGSGYRLLDQYDVDRWMRMVAHNPLISQLPKELVSGTPETEIRPASPPNPANLLDAFATTQSSPSSAGAVVSDSERARDPWLYPPGQDDSGNVCGDDLNGTNHVGIGGRDLEVYEHANDSDDEVEIPQFGNITDRSGDASPTSKQAQACSMKFLMKVPPPQSYIREPILPSTIKSSVNEQATPAPTVDFVVYRHIIKEAPLLKEQTETVFRDRETYRELKEQQSEEDETLRVLEDYRTEEEKEAEKKLQLDILEARKKREAQRIDLQSQLDDEKAEAIDRAQQLDLMSDLKLDYHLSEKVSTVEPGTPVRKTNFTKSYTESYDPEVNEARYSLPVDEYTDTQRSFIKTGFVHAAAGVGAMSPPPQQARGVPKSGLIVSGPRRPLSFFSTMKQPKPAIKVDKKPRRGDLSRTTPVKDNKKTRAQYFSPMPKRQSRSSTSSSSQLTSSTTTASFATTPNGKGRYRAPGRGPSFAGFYRNKTWKDRYTVVSTLGEMRQMCIPTSKRNIPYRNLSGACTDAEKEAFLQDFSDLVKSVSTFGTCLSRVLTSPSDATLRVVNLAQAPYRDAVRLHPALEKHSPSLLAALGYKRADKLWMLDLDLTKYRAVLNHLREKLSDMIVHVNKQFEIAAPAATTADAVGGGAATANYNENTARSGNRDTAHQVNPMDDSDEEEDVYPPQPPQPHNPINMNTRSFKHHEASPDEGAELFPTHDRFGKTFSAMYSKAPRVNKEPRRPLRTWASPHRPIEHTVTGSRRKGAVKLPLHLHHGVEPEVNYNYMMNERGGKRRSRISSTVRRSTDEYDAIEFPSFTLQPQVAQFGTVTRGLTYRMALMLTNTGVESGRFVVSQPALPKGSDMLLRVLYRPGIVAPGMQKKLELELYAGEEGDFANSVTIRTPRFTFNLPVIAVVVDPNTDTPNTHGTANGGDVSDTQLAPLTDPRVRAFGGKPSLRQPNDQPPVLSYSLKNKRAMYSTGHGNISARVTGAHKTVGKGRLAMKPSPQTRKFINSRAMRQKADAGAADEVKERESGDGNNYSNDMSNLNENDNKTTTPAVYTNASQSPVKPLSFDSVRI